MYNANALFEAHYYTLLQQTHAHANATNFFERCTARELLNDAEKHVARAQRSKNFCAASAIQFAQQAKAQFAASLRAS